MTVPERPGAGAQSNTFWIGHGDGIAQRKPRLGFELTLGDEVELDCPASANVGFELVPAIATGRAWPLKDGADGGIGDRCVGRGT